MVYYTLFGRKVKEGGRRSGEFHEILIFLSFSRRRFPRRAGGTVPLPVKKGTCGSLFDHRIMQIRPWLPSLMILESVSPNF